LALAPATDADLWTATAAEHSAIPLFAACFALFFSIFPDPRGSLRLRGVLLLPPLAVSALAIVELILPAFYPVDSALRSLILLIYLLLGAALMTRSFITTRDRATRRGLAIICGAAAAAILPFVLLYVFPTLLDRTPVLSSEHSILALALLPAGIAYAILRHDVLEMRLLQRWLVYGLLWSALISVYAAIGYALLQIQIGAPADRGRDLLAAFLLAALVGATCTRLVTVGQRMVDQALFKDHYDYRRSLREISRELSLLLDLHAMNETLLERLRRLLHVRFVVLLVQDAGAARALGGAGDAPTSLPAELAAVTRSAVDAPQLVAVANGDLDVLAVPLRTRDALVGHICLGPKLTGETFRADDLDLLATLGGHLAAIVRNAALLDDLRAKVRTLAARDSALNALNERLHHAQEEERRRLSADIHDEPLQTALTLQRLLARDCGPEHLDDAPLTLSRQLIEQLRAACAAMRPSTLDDLGLLPALDLLARDLGTRSEVLFQVEADPELAGTRLKPEIRLVFYRAAQEAINNSLRHGRPTTVRVTVRRDGGRAVMLVTDDGVGFAPPEHLHDLAAHGHLGLVGLRERVEQIGGKLTVCAAAGTGTVLRVELPLTGVRGGEEEHGRHGAEYR
jgi:two-component system, NarL family, sensor histidine kinase ComP